jgi:hypothetical protein
MSRLSDARATWPGGEILDRAMDAAFHEAVRRHRAADVPMVMWEDGEVKQVSPFEIPLPEEAFPRHAGRAPAGGCGR